MVAERPDRDPEAADRARIFRKIESIFGTRPRSYIGVDSTVTSYWGRFMISFDARDPVIRVQELVRAIARAEARITEVVGFFPERLRVVICRSAAELPADGTGPSHLPGWIGGSFDGTVRVLSDPLNDGTPHSLYVFLTHEMVHAALAAANGPPLPSWLEEGLAVHMSQELPGAYRAALAAALRQHRTVPLEQLEAPFSGLPAGLVPLAYAQSSSVVDFLASRMGPDRFRTLIQKAKRKGAQTMLKGESLTTSLLEQDWRRWAARQLRG